MDDCGKCLRTGRKILHRGHASGCPNAVGVSMKLAKRRTMLWQKGQWDAAFGVVSDNASDSYRLGVEYVKLKGTVHADLTAEIL